MDGRQAREHMVELYRNRREFYLKERPSHESDASAFMLRAYRAAKAYQIALNDGVDAALLWKLSN